jgi:hypothetical protein
MFDTSLKELLGRCRVYFDALSSNCSNRAKDSIQSATRIVEVSPLSYSIVCFISYTYLQTFQLARDRFTPDCIGHQMSELASARQARHFVRHALAILRYLINVSNSLLIMMGRANHVPRLEWRAYSDWRVLCRICKTRMLANASFINSLSRDARAHRRRIGNDTIQYR